MWWWWCYSGVVVFSSGVLVVFWWCFSVVVFWWWCGYIGVVVFGVMVLRQTHTTSRPVFTSPVNPSLTQPEPRPYPHAPRESHHPREAGQSHSSTAAVSVPVWETGRLLGQAGLTRCGGSSVPGGDISISLVPSVSQWSFKFIGFGNR